MSIGVVASSAVIAAGGAGYSAAVLADSPLAYWRLGETSGTSAADATGNGHVGTYQGAYTLGQTSLITGDTDPSVLFSGGRVNRPTTAWADVNSLTIEALMKPSSVSGIYEIVARDFNGGGGAASQWRIRINAGKIEFLLWHTGLTSLASATTLTANTRYHVAATYDGANMRLYINGTQDVSSAQTGVVTSPGTDINIATLGSNGEAFSGLIDEVAFYGSALSSARIAAHYAAA